MATLIIQGREFRVAAVPSSRGTAYELRGSRGALYLTIRNAKTPEYMFLINKRKPTGAIPAGFENVWLTDRDGELKLV